MMLEMFTVLHGAFLMRFATEGEVYGFAAIVVPADLGSVRIAPLGVFAFKPPLVASHDLASVFLAVVVTFVPLLVASLDSASVCSS